MSRDLAEKLANAANQTVRKQKAALSKRGPKVIMPGGFAHDATPYLSQMYKTRNATTVFNEPETQLKDPKPGWHYAWAEFHIGGGRPREGAMRTEAFIRKGHYVVIEPEEMKPDCEIPFSKGVTKKRVEVYDVMLVGIPPKAWEELYGVREAMGVMNVTRHFDQFQADVESAGATDVGVEATTEQV